MLKYINKQVMFLYQFAHFCQFLLIFKKSLKVTVAKYETTN